MSKQPPYGETTLILSYPYCPRLKQAPEMHRVKEAGGLIEFEKEVKVREAISRIGKSNDRRDWNTLTAVDWETDVFEDMGREAMDLAMKSIATHTAALREGGIPRMGRMLQLMQALPIDIFESRLRINAIEDGSIIAKLLDYILYATRNHLREFDHEPKPGWAACEVAAHLVTEVWACQRDRCEQYSAARTIAVLTYEIWTWAGEKNEDEEWQRLTWDKIGRLGASVSSAVLQSYTIRTQFGMFCSEEGERRWEKVMDWMDKRARSMASQQYQNIEDVGAMVRVMLLVTDLNRWAARMAVKGRFLCLFLEILAKFKEKNQEYLSTASYCIQTLTYGLSEADAETSAKINEKMLDSGILAPLRDVLLYTKPGFDHLSYVLSWFYLKCLSNALTHHESYPHIGKAFASLPNMDSTDVNSIHLKMWNNVVETVKRFNRGYDRYIKRSNTNTCDRTECQYEGLQTYQCSGCHQVDYCGKRCQSRAWNEGHKLDCQLYKTGDIQAPRTSKASRAFIAHVLTIYEEEQGRRCRGSFAEKEEGELVTEERMVVIHSIGLKTPPTKAYSLASLREHALTATIPTQFLRMLEMATNNDEYVLTAMALPDYPRQRFYVFGLFKENKVRDETVLVTAKTIEIAGLDEFVLSYDG